MTVVDNLEWNVLSYDWDKRKIMPYNIFACLRQEDRLLQLLTNHVNRTAFDSELQRVFRRNFWGCRKYELFVGNTYEINLRTFEKWDVFGQIIINFSKISEYLWSVTPKPSDPKYFRTSRPKTQE